MFSTIFKRKRTELSLSQEEIAYLLGVNRSTVSNWENREILPDIATLIKIADLFQCTIDYLLGRHIQNESKYKDFVHSTHYIGIKNLERNDKIRVLFNEILMMTDEDLYTIAFAVDLVVCKNKK